MQTLAFNLTATEWTEILGENNALALQVETANNVRLHFNDSATAPAINAASILVQSFPPQWDFECQSQVGQSRVWARADQSPARVIVVRRTA
jgi:hypothetical protein